jgi:hypothetical protein
MLISVALICASALVAKILWEFGREPILRRVYGDVPRLEIPTDLDKSLEFRVRIIDKRNYWLHLLVYYDNKEQRSQVEQVVGLHNDPGTPTTFHVIVRDESGRIIHDKSRAVVGSDGVGANCRVRRIDEFILSPGVYLIQVTPVGDLWPFRGLRTAYELMSHPKATPLRD